MAPIPHDERCDKDLLRIVARDSVDVEADAVDVFVTVEGSTLITGRAAMEKAREVRSLVEGLHEVGVEQEAVGVEGIEARTTSGLLTKSSSAVYRLKIHFTELDRLGDLLGVITSQKNADLTHLGWRYDDAADGEARRLRAAIERARVKADAAAAALGVKVVGVHRFVEGAPAPEPATHVLGAAAQGPMRSRMSQADLGLAVTHKKRVETTVTVDFVIE
jgi:uncharacterized protein YggE